MDRDSPQPIAGRGPPADPARYPHPTAFSIQLGRNLAVQGLGMGMVSLMGLSVAPWRAVAVWTLVAIAAVAAEHRLLGLIAGRGRQSVRAAAWAPAVRVLTTTIYAVAVFALVAGGGPAERLFAFALMSASMVHVLMRYYRSPRILIASLSPYVVVMVIVGFQFADMAWRQGRILGAIAPALAIAMISVQFWSARAQLSGAWTELMSARQAAEDRERAADAANRAKSQFLATMSHELRTPLHAVLGMVQSLMGDRLTRGQREQVGVIRRSSESLLAVLNDLLDLSKIEASALELEVVEFDLEHLVRGVAAAYGTLAAKKGLAFEFEVAEAARGRYLGDSARIRRMLYSLCDNAVKFTQSGGVSLRVDQVGDDLAFRVSDTGIGISESDLERLFEGFFQADPTLSRRYGGMGIGLAICRDLTKLMNGEIDASSVVGRGSTFVARLPLRRAAPPVETGRHADDLGEAASAAELRVLAAEDNTTNQLVLKTLLAPAGINPTLVLNGREALAAWESQAWDIVLMDIQMPEMNGIEATRAIRLRERETGRARTPIVAVTANAMTDQLAEYRAAGMDGAVAKPVEIGALFRAMEQAIASTAADPAEQPCAEPARDGEQARKHFA